MLELPNGESWEFEADAGDLVIEESRMARLDPEKTAQLLAQEALARGPRTFAPDGARGVTAHVACRKLRRGLREARGGEPAEGKPPASRTKGSTDIDQV